VHYQYYPEDGRERLYWNDNKVSEEIKAASTLPVWRDFESGTSDHADFADLHIRLEGDALRVKGEVRTTLSSLISNLSHLGAAATAAEQVVPAPVMTQPATTRGEIVAPAAAAAPKQLGRNSKQQPAYEPSYETAGGDPTQGISMYDRWANRKRMNPRARKMLLGFVGSLIFYDAMIATGMGVVTKATGHETHAHGVIVNFGHFPGFDMPWTAYERIRHPKEFFGE
jgi:hypothetical protein